MKYNPKAHRNRRTEIHGYFFIILLAMALFWLYGCSPQRGCPATSGKNFKSGYGWIKCKQSGKVCVLSPNGKIVCSYYEPVLKTSK